MPTDFITLPPKFLTMVVAAQLLLLSSCGGTDTPTSHTPVPTVMTTPPPEPRDFPTPEPRAFASLSGQYSVSALTIESSAPCDVRAVASFKQDLIIDIRVDGDTRTAAVEVVRSRTGHRSRFRGSVDTAFAISAAMVDYEYPAGSTSGCGQPNETLMLDFLGPNYDGCQGFTGWINTQYASGGLLREAFIRESC